MKNIKSYFLLATLLLLLSCSKDDSSPVSAGNDKVIRIISFSPEVVHTDSLVAVKYLNDAGSSGKTYFFVGNTPVIEMSRRKDLDTLISYLSVNKVKSGRIRIVCGKFTDSTDKVLIIIDQKLSLYDFEPKSGTAGTLVSIKAWLPDTIINNYKVKFGNLFSNIISINKSGDLALLLVRAPDSVYTSNIIIKSASDSAVSENKFFVQNSQPPYEINKPQIRDFNPKSGGWNQEITITGMNFGKQTGDTRVFLGDVECPVKSLSNYEMKIELPLNAKTGKFSVINKAGADTAANMLQYLFITKAQIIIQSIKYQGYHVYRNPGSGDSSYYDSTYNRSSIMLNMQNNEQQNQLSYSASSDRSTSRYTQTNNITIKIDFDISSNVLNRVFLSSTEDYLENPGNNFAYHNYYDSLDFRNLPFLSADNNSWTFEARGDKIKDYVSRFSLYKFDGVSRYLQSTYDKYYFIKFNPMDNTSLVRIILYR